VLSDLLLLILLFLLSCLFPGNEHIGLS